MKYTTKILRGRDYAAPEMEVCSFEVEQGFSASLGGGIIEDAKNEDWGTL
jgi:hypothetical protein